MILKIKLNIFSSYLRSRLIGTSNKLKWHVPNLDNINHRIFPDFVAMERQLHAMTRLWAIIKLEPIILNFKKRSLPIIAAAIISTVGVAGWAAKG